MQTTVIYIFCRYALVLPSHQNASPSDQVTTSDPYEETKSDSDTLQRSSSFSKELSQAVGKRYPPIRPPPPKVTVTSGIIIITP